MKANIKVKILLLAVLMVSFSLFQLAMASCDRISLVADKEWPPYLIQNETGMSGISVDIANIIFGELDLPIQWYFMENRQNILYALELGDIDVLMATYNFEGSEKYLDLVKPGIVDDHLQVVMRKGKGTHVAKFDDLIGLRGVTTSFFAFDRVFESYRDRYLYVQGEGDLASLLDVIETRKADYLVGSGYQLNYVLQNSTSTRDLEIAAVQGGEAPIYMAFSKNGTCRGFYPYALKRVADLKSQGTIDEIAARYTKKNETSIQQTGSES